MKPQLYALLLLSCDPGGGPPPAPVAGGSGPSTPEPPDDDDPGADGGSGDAGEPWPGELPPYSPGVHPCTYLSQALGRDLVPIGASVLPWAGEPQGWIQITQDGTREWSNALGPQPPGRRVIMGEDVPLIHGIHLTYGFEIHEPPKAVIAWAHVALPPVEPEHLGGIPKSILYGPEPGTKNIARTAMLDGGLGVLAIAHPSGVPSTNWWFFGRHAHGMSTDAAVEYASVDGPGAPGIVNIDGVSWVPAAGHCQAAESDEGDPWTSGWLPTGGGSTTGPNGDSTG